MPSQKVYSLKDVAEHNTPEEPWLIIHDNVYNIKNLLPDHPGGQEILIDYAGKNATDAFEKKGHSKEARNWLKDFHIGVLSGSSADESQKWYRSRIVVAGSVFAGVAAAAAAIGIAVYKAKRG